MKQQGRPLIEFLGLDDYCPVPKTASLLVCAYRSVSPETCESLIGLANRGTFRFNIRHGDAWIGRARSVVASQWYRLTPDDVFVMVDADIVFQPDDIEKLVEQCRRGYEVVCADYPVHNGQFLAGAPQEPAVTAGDLISMEAVPTGCVAVHRSVLTRLIETMPLCHANLPIAYWPFFISFIEDVQGAQDIHVALSEDYAFSLRARRAGFNIWRDTSIKISHLSEFPLTVDNMQAMHQASGLSW